MKCLIFPRLEICIKVVRLPQDGKGCLAIQCVSSSWREYMKQRQMRIFRQMPDFEVENLVNARMWPLMFKG